MKLLSYIVFGILILIVGTTDLRSQARTSYQALNFVNNSPTIFLDQVFLPSDDEKTEINLIFRINYEYLTFKRLTNLEAETPGETYESDIEIVFDFFDKETPAVPDRPFIARETWSAKVIAHSYEETKSGDLFISGTKSIKLPPDSYRMYPTITINGQEVSGVTQRAEANRRLRNMSRRDRERFAEVTDRSLIHVPDFSDNKTSYMLLLSDTKMPGSENPVLVNMGRNVYYARDYQILIGVHNELESDSITVKLSDIGANPMAANRNERNEKDELVWATSITDEAIWPQSGVAIQSDTTSVRAIRKDSGAAYNNFIITVPNHRFKNSWYALKIESWNNGNPTLMSRHQYLSRWFDIPSSLLNIDIAIENLKFMLEPDQIREMRRGNAEEKERKFRAFWAEKDPTPETDYNELMTEYYTRIDDAYKKFTTPSKPGHDSDQGRIYITYGPPDSIDRRFPTSGATQEVWRYGSRTFIFSATSGFGDFQLITQSN